MPFISCHKLLKLQLQRGKLLKLDSKSFLFAAFHFICLFVLRLTALLFGPVDSGRARRRERGGGMWVPLVVQLQLKQQQRPRLIYGQRAFLECFVAKNPLGTSPPLAHAPAWAVAHPVCSCSGEKGEGAEG